MIENLKDEFNVHISKSLLSKEEWNHTAFLFLLKKEINGYRLKRIYTQIPFDKERITKNILENLND